MMKKSLFGLLAAAAVLPVSGAVVNYSWTGSSGTVVSGQITYTGAGLITEAGVTGMTMSVNQPGALLDLVGGTVDLGSLLISFTGTTQTAASFTSITVLDDSNWVLEGNQGAPTTWSFHDNTFAGLDGDGDIQLTLTAVPEPEMVAGVAGLGLLAFGAARRRFMKA